MTVIGAPNEWVDFIEDKLPELLRLIEDVWAVLARPFPDTGEDAITTQVCRGLRNLRNIRGLCFYIDTQLVELDPADGQGLGRLDIVFRPSGGSGPPNEAIYLCLECKRLNVLTSERIHSRASEYVSEGMLRFVSGQYSRTVRHGTMVGYVIDNNVSAALTSVEGVVRTRHIELLMDAPGILHPSLVSTLPTARESFHLRINDTVPFHMHHLFLAVG